MARRKVTKKTPKKGKDRKEQPSDATGMARSFDQAMDRIAKAPWPPRKSK